MNDIGYLVISFDDTRRIINLNVNDEVKSYVLPKSQCKLSKNYLKKGDIYLLFNETNKEKEINGILIKQIQSINKITLYNGEYSTLYSVNSIKDEIKELIKSFDYLGFVDFEFTMPEYGSTKKFITEIMQVGCVITNKEDEIVNEFGEYIDTKYKISSRTINFLRLDTDELSDSISRKKFYSWLKQLNEIYSPTVITWGGGDKKELSQFYKINKFEPIDIKFIDLSNLIKKYFLMSNDISLFKALKIFNNIDATQAHHALTDAASTKEVFVAFKNIVLNDIEFNIKEKLDIKNKEE